jgi:hypothetical protein
VEANSHSLAAHEKLEFLRKKLLQSRNDSGVLGTALDGGTASDRPDSPEREIQAVPDSLGNSYTEDDATSVTEVTGALQLARIVWAGRANQYRPRQRPDASSSPRASAVPTNYRGSAKDQFVHDVVEVIKETRLYAEDTVPQEVLDKLSGIVSKAVGLEHTLTSPEISAQQTYALRSLGTVAERGIIPSSPGRGAQLRGTFQLPAPGAQTDSTVTSPEIVAGAELSQIPSEPETFRASILTSLTEHSDEVSILGRLSRDFDGSSLRIGPEPLSLGDPAMSTSGSSASVVASSDNQSVAPFPSRSHPIEEEVEDIIDRRVLSQEGLQGWVKICSPQTGLQPTTCTLEITESAGSICVDVVATPRYTTARSIEDSVQLDRTSAPSTSSKRSLAGNNNPAYSRRFKHLFTPDARPIPSVLHPYYEGPTFGLDEPYNITFTEKQVLKEIGNNEPLRRVADLKYIFSHEDYRDRVRSLLFGKDLLVNTGVKRILFSYIACERQAVSLWFDTHANHKTITFFRTSKDKKGRPQGEVEYEVLGIEEYKSAENNEEPLVLFVKPLPDPETPQSPPRRASTFLSAISRHSATSTIVGDSDRCSLYFSDIAGKTKFLNGLKGRGLT